MKKLTQTEFSERMKKLHPYIKVLGNYDGNAYRIEVECTKDKHKWSPTAGSLLAGHGCPVCGNTKPYTEKEFVDKLAAVRPDVELVGKYVRMQERTEFFYKKCGHQCKDTPSHVLNEKRGCPECGKINRRQSQKHSLKDVIDFIETEDLNINLAENQRYENEHSVLTFICNDCGEEIKKTYKDLKKFSGCSHCRQHRTSFFEQFLYHSIAHTIGYDDTILHDKSAIGKELDIYIPRLKIAIEPGSWNFHKRERVFESDLIKQELCNNNGITLITVYDHYNMPDPPFRNCIVSKKGFGVRLNIPELKNVVIEILDRCGIRHGFSEEAWKNITQNAIVGSKRMTIAEVADEVRKINPNFEVFGECKKGKSIEYKLKCTICGHRWSAGLWRIRHGSGCEKCAGHQKKTQEEFLAKLSEINPDIIPLGEYVNSKTSILVQCKYCKDEWPASPDHLLARNIKDRTKCQNCFGKEKYPTHALFVERVMKKHPSLTLTSNYERMHTKVTIKCNMCNQEYEETPKNLEKDDYVCKYCHPKPHPNAKPVICLSTGEIFESVNAAARKYSISHSAIVNCCSKLTKTADGKEWEYHK